MSKEITIPAPTKITIAGFEKMSKQRIFDKAVKLISGTRKKSTLGIIGGGCCYTGTGCNAAPLIRPEERNWADGNGGSWKNLVGMGVVPKNNAEFIIELQNAHDGCKNPDFMAEWKERMMALAGRWNLNTSRLEKVEI